MGQARDEAGNIWETDAQGQAIRLLQPAQGPQMPADPAFPYQGAQAAAQAQNTGAQAQVNSATVPAQITAANADATAKTRTAQTAGLPEGFMWGPDGSTAVPIPGYTRQGLSPEVRQAAIQAYTDAGALERAADEIERLYRSGPGATQGVWGIQDYFPTDTNKVFNDAGQQARGYVKRALGFTGGEGNTVAESSALYDPYLPTAGDRDVQIEAKIRKLRELANDSRAKSTTTLGGAPDANGNITPQRNDRPNAMTMDRLMGGGPSTGGAAPAGSTTGTTPIPPAMQAEFEAGLPKVMPNGRFDPQAYAAWRTALDEKYGFSGTGFTGHLAWANSANSALAGPGGATLNTTIPAPEAPLSLKDQQRNDMVSNPFGAAAAGFADMVGFGGVSAAAPDQMAALGAAEPTGMMLGQIGGSLAGTAGLGKLGAETLGRGMPRLLGGGSGAQFGRNLATDMAYSGIYGGVTEGDPLSSAVEGGVGSAGGQLFGKGVGRAIGGVDLAPAVQALRSRGIPMTVPQQLGGFIKGMEDKAMSVPLVGDMIRARRMEGMGAFNREAFNEAGGPINATVSTIGEQGVEELADQVSDAYGTATRGAAVEFDPEFVADMGQAGSLARLLPDDYQPRFNKMVQNRVWAATDPGELTGENFQQAVRGLKAARNSAASAIPGFEQEYRDALTAAEEALTGQMMRGGAPGTVSGLNAANAANRNLRTIEDATNRAAGGTETGTPFVFTPSQLQRAGMKTQSRFPGPRPFADLADSGQAVLPSRVPNSGTADRAAQMLLPGALVGGAGLGALSADESPAHGAGAGAGISLALTAALLAGGTKTGQKAVQKLLIDRPVVAQQLGRQIRNRAGIFGHAALPLLVAN